MIQRIPLSFLCSLVQEAVDSVFYNQTFWVIAELTDVKKYVSKGWCFLKLVEKRKEQIVAEMQAVLWNQTYPEITKFEKQTGRKFRDGLEVSCLVRVNYHIRYGLKAEILEIDAAFTLGQMELEKQLTLRRLVEEFPEFVWVSDGEYSSANQDLALPKVLQRIALVGARNSDGYRDFMQELLHNAWGYDFHIEHFQTNVQGQHAALQISTRLDEIRHNAPRYDAVVMVRGGGSATDLFPFDDFGLAQRIASLPLPVFTGIGHDRNTSIADMMGWQHKTPTKVAAAILHHNRQFEEDLLELTERMKQGISVLLEERRMELQRRATRLGLALPHKIQFLRHRLTAVFPQLNLTMNRRWLGACHALPEKLKLVENLKRKQIEQKNIRLNQTARLVEQSSPDFILKRGFALIMQENKLVTSGKQLDATKKIKTVLHDAEFESIIDKIDYNGKNKNL